MAKFDTNQKRGKRNNKALMRQLHIVISSRNAEAVDPDAWDAYDVDEPIQRTHFDLSD